MAHERIHNRNVKRVSLVEYLQSVRDSRMHAMQNRIQFNFVQMALVDHLLASEVYLYFYFHLLAFFSFFVILKRDGNCYVHTLAMEAKGAINYFYTRTENTHNEMQTRITSHIRMVQHSSLMQYSNINLQWSLIPTHNRNKRKK